MSDAGSPIDSGLLLQTLGAYAANGPDIVQAKLVSQASLDTSKRVGLLALFDDDGVGFDISTRLQALENDKLGLGIISNYDPLLAVASVVTTANNRYYSRILCGGTINKIGIDVIVQSGNIRVAVYRNKNSGRDALPGVLLADSGTVACPAVGYAEIALGATIDVEVGDWFSIASDNATSSMRCLANTAFSSNLYKGRSGAAAASFTPVADPTISAAGSKPYLMIGIPV